MLQLAGNFKIRDQGGVQPRDEPEDKEEDTDKDNPHAVRIFLLFHHLFVKIYINT